MCFCHDLIKTLENPFEVARQRTAKYLTISIIIPIVIMAIIWPLSNQQHPSRFYDPGFKNIILKGEAEV